MVLFASSSASLDPASQNPDEIREILWGAIKGAKTPRPKVVRNVQADLLEEDED